MTTAAPKLRQSQCWKPMGVKVRRFFTVTARDRECAGGVGRFCRQREDAVTERRRALEVAMRDVVQTADPQIEAATRMIAWLTAGWLKPTGDDFATVRLILLALLPQIGGVLLVVARPAPEVNTNDRSRYPAISPSA